MMIRLATSILASVVLCFLVSLHASADQNDPRLDKLFSELAATHSSEDAEAIEAKIWSIWLVPPPGQEVAAAMERGLQSMALGQGFDAMRAFDQVIKLAPDFAEGWNKRATVRYLLGDLDGSIADIDRTLKLEPRHFGALSGLGLCRLAQEKPAEALDAFDAALKINPNLRERDQIEALRKKVKGLPL